MTQSLEETTKFQKSENVQYEYESHYTINKKEYTFTIRPEEKEGLDERLLEDPILKNTVFNKNKNDKIHASIEYSIRKQSNSIIDCFGIPESGKSTIEKIIGFHLYHRIEDFGFKPKLLLTFDYVNTIHAIWKHFKNESRKSNEILIVQQDEANDLSGPESRAYKKQINNMLKTFRAAQVFVLFASPDDTPLSVCNMKIEAIAKDENKRVNWGIYYVPKRKDTSKLIFTPVGSILLEYTIEMEKWYADRINYDKLKMQYILDVIDNRGMQTVSIPFEIIEDNANRLVSRAKEIGVRQKSQMETLAKTMGLGTTTITEASVDHAKLLWDIWQEEEREKKAALLDKEKSIKQEEHEKRIRRLVVDVAEELASEFNFMNDQFKSQSQIVKGWVMDNYREDWTDLMPYVSNMWYLAKWWQFSNLPKLEDENFSEKLQNARSNVETLRTSFEQAVFYRYKNSLLAQRSAFLFIQKPGTIDRNWTKADASKTMREILEKNNMKDSTFRQYWVQHSDDEENIRSNGKIWGDAGELYLSNMIEKIVQKGRNDGWIENSIAIDSICAAKVRTNSSKLKQLEELEELNTDEGNPDAKEKDLSIYDVELYINKQSVAAFNSKFTYIDNQSFKMHPEYQHHNPFLFVINRHNLEEFLLPSKTGKEYLTINEGNRSQLLTLEELIRSLIHNLKL